jgi:cytochrome P450
MSDRTTQGARPVDVHFEPFNPEQVDRYPEQIKEIRERCPVAWSDGHWSEKDTGFWLLTRNKDVREAAMNWQLFSNDQGGGPIQWDLNLFRLLPLESDPPLHTSIRGTVSNFFSNKTLSAHEDKIRKIVKELLDECIQHSPVDFARKYSISLPSRVLFEIIFGEDPKEIGWIYATVETMFADISTAAEQFPKLIGWCASVLEGRRQSGSKEDILGVIAHAGNEPDFKLEETQRIYMLLMLILAGMDTTAGGISAILLTMATEPEIRKRMATADAGQVNKAVDEFLRYSSPVPAAGRTLTADTEVGGCPMRKGERVTLNWTGANHDPEVYPNPDVLDLERNASQHVAFGVGHHKCLGMHLAKLELRLTIEELSKLSVFELVPGTKITYQTGPARGVVSLPILCAR